MKNNKAGIAAGLFLLGAIFFFARGAEGQPNVFRDPNVDSNVISHALQADGKILICGTFFNVGSQTHSRIARLNADGTVDSGFQNLSPNDTVRSVALQTDGRILIGGSFDSLGGFDRSRIARLNASGTVDISFQDPLVSMHSSVDAITIQPDGKILIGGNITSVAGETRIGIARLNADGSLDTTFQTTMTGTFGGIVSGITLQPDGKILIAGDFTTVGGEARRNAARLNNDGSLDASFQDPVAGNAQNPSNVKRIILQPDGRVLITGGNFTSVGGQIRGGVTRLNANGSLDSSFQAQDIPSSAIQDIKLQADGKFLIAGAFQTVNGQARANLARLNSDGTLDLSLPSPNVSGDTGVISTIGIQPNGKILAAGNFTAVGLRTRRRVVRFNADGSLEFARTFADFDGDEKADISIYRPSVGQWWVFRSYNSGNFAVQFGAASDKLAPADFTGDGKTDAAIFRPKTGEWFILRSEDFSYYSFPFGTNGDIPAVGDFDGDGKSDNAVFRPSDTNWYIRRSSDGGTTIQQFGASNDAPAVADYDGDGKADIAIWRASVGEWWIQKSTDSSVVAFQFGNSSDKPVQGDYTRDGKADVAIWRPVSGEWFILRSENDSYYSFPFGTNGDVPAPADFDSDGKIDAAVFRPSSSTWYIQRANFSTLVRPFGAAGDVPVPSAFIPQ
jgi:uncharacterized delta-60 repeat protein